MTKTPKATPSNELSLTTLQFLDNYNRNIPRNYPHVSLDLLERFKSEHLSLFKADGLWTLDKHRKHMIDWLQNIWWHRLDKDRVN